MLGLGPKLAAGNLRNTASNKSQSKNHANHVWQNAYLDGRPYLCYFSARCSELVLLTAT